MTNLQTNYTIAIIGGGMVGASLALLLAQKNRDWQILLLNAQAVTETSLVSSSFDYRSTAVSYGSVEILTALGVWDGLAKQATPIRQVHVSDAGHFMGGLIDAKTYNLPAVGYVVPNAALGHVLHRALHEQHNIHLLAPASVEKIIPKQQGAGLQVATPTETFLVDTSLAIIADGGDSPLRNSLGIDVSTTDYGQTAIIANVSYSEAHNGIAYERFTAEGPLAMLPLGHSPSARESALVLTLANAQAEEINTLDDAEFLEYLQKRFGFRLGKFLSISKRYSYPLKLTKAKEQVRSHLALVGNAAHFLHPVAGQGFNLSLRDCACLAEVLQKAALQNHPLGELAVLQNFVEQQSLDQLLTIEFSDKLVRLFSNAQLPLIALRHLGFVGLDVLPLAKSRFAAQTMGTAGALFL